MRRTCRPAGTPLLRGLLTGSPRCEPRPPSSLADQLAALTTMLRQGLLTRAEFATAKSHVLAETRTGRGG